MELSKSHTTTSNSSVQKTKSTTPFFQKEGQGKSGSVSKDEAPPFFQPKRDIDPFNHHKQKEVNSIINENSKFQIQAKRSRKKTPPPEPMVSQAPRSIVTKEGKLTSSAIYILNKMTGVDVSLLSNVEIKVKPVGEFPYYNPMKGGGAITIGNTISFTVNWFDKTGYYRRKKKGTWEDKSYGENSFEWLSLLSHEVLHLPQAQAFGIDEKGINKYKWFFFGQYIKYLGHNNVPFEKEAETGHVTFVNLLWDFTIKSKNILGVQLTQVLNDKSLKSDGDREKAIKALLSTSVVEKDIKKITQWWKNKNPKAFKRAKKQKNKANKKRSKREV